MSTMTTPKKPMSQFFVGCKRLFARFRHPFNLPEEIAEALGLPLSNFLSFEELVKALSCGASPHHLFKYMSREEAEALFNNAARREYFNQNSLFYYHFHQGWVGFNLYFDSDSKLRRIYLQHKYSTNDRGIEIPLK